MNEEERNVLGLGEIKGRDVLRQHSGSMVELDVGKSESSTQMIGTFCPVLASLALADTHEDHLWAEVFWLRV